MSATTINARDAAKALDMGLLDLSQILRDKAQAILEGPAARAAGKLDGLPSDLIEKAQNLLASARACENAYDEDHPDEPEEGDAA